MGKPPTAARIKDDVGYDKKKHQAQVSKSDTALEELCSVCGLKTRRESNGTLVVEAERGDGLGKRRIYPNHPPIDVSFERARGLLALPLERPSPEDLGRIARQLFGEIVRRREAEGARREGSDPGGRLQ